MSTFWWKTMILQVLMTAVMCSTGLEFDDTSKLSEPDKDIIWLFNKLFIENLKQHDTENPTEKTNQIMRDNSYHQSSSLPINWERNFEKFLGSELKNDDMQLFEDQNSNNYGHYSKKRGAPHHYTGLCYFKLCNYRSMENYRNFMPHTKKNYAQLY